MPSRIPPKPDFAALEAAAVDTADTRTKILALIGQLVFGWSNNESMFIYLLMVLLETDEISAAIVFATLNTTRGRLDLVQRLAKAKIVEPTMLARLDDIVERFNRQTRVRNEFNHCMYSVDENGEITQTQSMKIEERRGSLRFGTIKKMDDTRIARMNETISQMAVLNRDIWSLLPDLQSHMQARRNVIA
ncbi:MAG TPA: hypothetical protein VLQ65_06400 [Saliniramus sp.]|nr:hypothetical protein [Saliniramus sp.]